MREVTAYDIMREWDREAGIQPREEAEYNLDVPGSIPGDWEDWKARIEAGDELAIVQGRRAWGLPVLR